MTSKGWISLIAGALLTAPLLGSASFAEEVEAEAVKGSVARGAFTTAIVDREPQDNLDSLGKDLPKERLSRVVSLLFPPFSPASGGILRGVYFTSAHPSNGEAPYFVRDLFTKLIPLDRNLARR